MKPAETTSDDAPHDALDQARKDFIKRERERLGDQQPEAERPQEHASDWPKTRAETV